MPAGRCDTVADETEKFDRLMEEALDGNAESMYWVARRYC